MAGMKVARSIGLTPGMEACQVARRSASNGRKRECGIFPRFVLLHVPQMTFAQQRAVHCRRRHSSMRGLGNRTPAKQQRQQERCA
jgi:hypothetical protein